MSEDRCQIRAARPGDAALIHRFVAALAAYEKLSHEAEATVADFDTALFGESPRVFCEIAKWDGEPVGFALWFHTFSTFRGRHGIYLEDLFVLPEARGRGIGKALLKHLARRCIEDGLARFEWSVLDWNAPSIAFYEAQGATVMREWLRCRVDGEALRSLGT
ncbi:GNAT family N-acetyltransferase [Kaistia geumhonensis]|uniref:GNAT superfamily N-acetyltransferase n=1 Tax=Kaistia geumhonensis TaxID=410839 RepID=A0ABU0MC08_9HYPH|nr:GNAT family N-acetyltransferase [Kaistia geumhonensis]MCX5481433.1 GNAT family N-acetyltransferase [Kaistia geumhonensis]MDQ0518498.1 GNAT superfamily N-acetyltransferase [Kaistia geumhonensis]